MNGRETLGELLYAMRYAFNSVDSAVVICQANSADLARQKSEQMLDDAGFSAKCSELRCIHSFGDPDDRDATAMALAWAQRWRRGGAWIAIEGVLGSQQQ